MTVTSIIDYDSLVQPDRIHGRLYYDPAIFEEELEKIWYREWVYVGHESEIPEHGDYRTRLIGLQPIIMTRDEDGGVHLLMNRCAHRGNTVCQMERGNSHAFRCAYHGWTFANDGHLLGVTYASAYGPDFDRSQYGLTKVPRVANYRGFIFGSMSPTGPSLEEHLGNAKPLLDQLINLSPTGEVDVRAGTHKVKVDANWKMQLENSVDNYHANFIHESAFSTPAQRRASGTMSSDKSAAVTRDLGNGHTQLDFWPQQRKTGEVRTIGGSIFDPVPEAAQKAYADAMKASYGEERAQEIMRDGPPHFMIYPNLFIINFDIRVIQPVSVNKTHIYQHFVRLKGVPPEINTFRLRVHEYYYGPSGAIIPDDVDIFERNQIAFEARVNEWLDLRRGLHRERRDENGMRIGHLTDEITQRAQWQHYKKLMQRA
jgi:fatty-acyl-CoA synthase